MFLLRIIVKVSASFQLILSNHSFFCRMEDQTFDCEDGNSVENVVSDENHSGMSAWNFCNSMTLPKSEL